MFIIDVIDACSRVYRTYDIRENLKLGFVVKVVAGLRDEPPYVCMEIQAALQWTYLPK